MIFYKVPVYSIPNIHFLSYEHLTKEHTHMTRVTREMIIYVITSGRLRLQTNTGALTLVPGDVHVFQKGEFQSALSEEECEYYYFHLHNNFEAVEFSGNEISEYYFASQNHFLSSNQYADELFCKEYDTLIIPKHFNISGSAYESKIYACLKSAVLDAHTEKTEHYKFCAGLHAAEFFIMLHRACSETTVRQSSVFNDGMIKEIIEYLESNMEKHITGDILEKKFGYSFDYMNRCFKRSIGQTIFAYLGNVRINMAKNMMYTQKKSVTRIAEETGFCDIYYFSRVFRRKTGMTPTEYLKILHKQTIV